MINIKNIILLIIILTALFFRFYKISENPPGLYWDETAFGYDAYSILKTAHDHHGKFLPLFFESFGDWKLPGYFYLLVPSIAIFGLNEFAVRFPAAFLGLLTVPVLYLVVNKLTRNTKLSLLSAFFLAVSPWHIQFSRAGFESTTGLFFLVLGLYFFLISVKNPRGSTYLISFTLFVFSAYTYHAYRIFTPLLLVTLFLIYKSEIIKNMKFLIFPIIISIALFLPLATFTLTSEGQARALSQSVFKKDDFENARISYDQKSKKPLRFLSKYLYNQPAYYSYIATKGYLDNLSPIFLFFSGDQIGRHSQVDMGQLHSFEIILFILGLVSLKNLPKKSSLLIASFLLLSPMPSIIVTPTPHAYRTLQMALPLAITSALGANYLFFKKGTYLVKVLAVILIFYSILSHSHLLFEHYPRKFAADWQDGNKEMVKLVKKHEANFEKVYITNINQVPYIYLLFFQKYDPEKFIDENGNSQFFSKYFFISENESIYNKGKILYVAPSWQKVDGTWLDAVNDNTGRHVYSLWEVNSEP